ncbi:hypothetical protein PMPD1_2497 [Paramixta manurensis]|uniref:Antitermination protein n=1 Tax=Paramixta manurensis TaxID=2740817 RepID=A0A6M8UCH9_9GAMM|nr:hypothetical protein PMPD1_2497 [Erwiniaceae bacterium PD-1]
MIKLQNLKPNARTRRDERRKAKQKAWAAANPMLVGHRYRNIGESPKIVQKPGYEPKPIKFIALDIFWAAREYKLQIIRATYLYEYEFKHSHLAEGPICLADVAIYRAGHRKSTTLTAR